MHSEKTDHQFPEAARRVRPSRKPSAKSGSREQGKPDNFPTAPHHRDARRTGHGKEFSTGHGRRNRGFDALPENMGTWETDPSKLPQDGFTVQVAPRGFLTPLLEELGEKVITVLGRLVLARETEMAHWAQNIWMNPVWIEVSSIGDAAKKLTRLQRNWRAHYPEENGLSRRMVLIENSLPHVSCRPLAFGDALPTAPLGAFTLLTPNLMLASDQTSSPFPDGEVRFEENKIDPPGRAYLKLWESFTLLGKAPRPGELCLEMGAAPGSWSWVLAGLGAKVFSIDKAPLAENVSRMPNVNHCLGSGFALNPEFIGCVDWLFSDMICYPSRLLAMLKEWMTKGAMRHALCTLKFQSETDHETARAFAAIPGSRLLHLSCNRHELTWFWEANAKEEEHV